MFGAVVARALDTWWAELGSPDPYVVIDAGAGAGALARSVLTATPACRAALRYLLVERSQTLRNAQAAVLPLELPAFVIGPVVGGDDDSPAAVVGTGPLLASLAELPAQPVTGVIIANELLDNMPFALVERRRDGWHDVRVGAGLEEVVVPARPDVAAEAERHAPDADAGARIPLQRAAQDWLRHALATIHRGRVVVLDYADWTPSLSSRPWTEWVRTYRSHGPGGRVFDEPGSQDITCEVAVDQLARVRPPDLDRSQADFLRAHGIDELVTAAQAAWRERAHVGDLDTLAARSRVTEAAALTDPDGLGAFRVLEWVIG